MHESFDVEANVALIQTHAVDRSFPPRVSEYCSETVPVMPDPFSGVAASAVTTAAPGVGAVPPPPDEVPPPEPPLPPEVVPPPNVLLTLETVHAPRVCQPLFTPAPLAAYM